MRFGKMRLPGVFLLAAVALWALPPAGLAQQEKNKAAIDHLRKTAWDEGQVQVIVGFAVPEIEHLTAVSTRFWGLDETTEIAVERGHADEALTMAIEYASWKILADLQGTDYEVLARYDYIPFIALQVSPNALAVLENSPNVLGIEENRAWKLIEPPQENGEGEKGGGIIDDSRVDPMLDDTATLVGAAAVWAMGYTGAGWYVAVLDTGIRRTHQFFTGKTIIEACRASGRDGNPGNGGDCPNGLASQNGAGSAVHYSNTYSGFDHGTHVAGIATGKYGTLAGMAKGAGIIAVKIFSKFTAADCGGSPCVSAYDVDIIAGLNYIYSLRDTYHIASVNMSLGGGKYPSFCDTANSSMKTAIDLLRAVGIATAIATGNNGYCNYISYPACISTSVAVGSSTKTDGDSPFNNWDPDTQRLYAPGSAIYSSTGDSNSSYASWNGTSMATPHVAGAWALLKQANPGAKVTTVLNALRATGKSISAPCPGSVPIPRIQIDKALVPHPPANLTGSKVLNRSFSQAEYIDVLSWENNSNNAGLTIASYKIYTVQDSVLTLLTEVDADQTTYSRRNAGEGSTQYAVVAVKSGGIESEPALVTVTAPTE